MTLVNNNKMQYDLPQWYPMAPLPFATAAGSATCTADDGSDSCIYSVNGTTFFRYSTIANGYQQLANIPTATVTSVALKYSKYAGYRCNCLGVGASTATLAAINPSLLIGKTIRVVSGAGAGQDRTITACGPNIVGDKGLITAVAATGITDASKNWATNQWVGYQVRFTYGAAGQTVVRKVLYNDATNLYFYDPNYQQLEPWQNTQLYTAAPYTLPVVTAGLQAHYVIESAVVTTDSPWTVTPDFTSTFVLLTGGIFAITANASAPFSTMYYYDMLSDTWTTKTNLGGYLLSALTGDWNLERCGEVSGPFATGTITSAGASTVVPNVVTINGSVCALVADRYANHQIRITAGSGMGQRRRIVGHTTTTITVEKPWVTNPDATSTFAIYGNVNTIFLSGNNQSSMYQYNVEEDIWSLSNTYDSGYARNGSITFGGQEGIAITSIVRNGGGITVLNPTPTAGGSGYSIGDVLTLTASGTFGKAKVTGITSAGAVTSVMLYRAGSGYVTGTGLATSGGTGTLCTLAITTVGITGYVTTAMNHNLAIGDSYVGSGGTEALYNAGYTVLGCDSLTSFDISTTATATWVATASQGTTLLVDSVKNWALNEHAGRLVTITTSGVAPTSQVRRITSNTSSALTLNAAITTAVNGTSRYVIHEPYVAGRATQFPINQKDNIGYASAGGSTTTLVDTTKNWIPGQWIGARFRIQCGTGYANEVAITANTNNTLTFAAQTFTPDATTKYMIMDSYGLVTAGLTTSITDTTKKWITNQWAGKRCKIMSGTGLSQEFTITSNTATALAFTAITTAPDTTSNYCILESQTKGTGSTLNWVFANTDTTNLTQGKYLHCFFGMAGGSGNVYGKYDITKELWEISVITSPQSELFNTGSSFAYSGKDRIYFQVNSTGRVGYVDVNSLVVTTHLQVTQAPLGAAVAGNRMEVVTTSQGTDILYLLDNSGQRVWRTFILFS